MYVCLIMYTCMHVVLKTTIAVLFKAAHTLVSSLNDSYLIIMITLT